MEKAEENSQININNYNDQWKQCESGEIKKPKSLNMMINDNNAKQGKLERTTTYKKLNELQNGHLHSITGYEPC